MSWVLAWFTRRIGAGICSICGPFSGNRPPQGVDHPADAAGACRLHLHRELDHAALYREARILLESRDGVFTRPGGERDAGSQAIDQEAVTSQVQLIMSR